MHLQAHFCIGLALINQSNQGEPLHLAPDQECLNVKRKSAYKSTLLIPARRPALWSEVAPIGLRIVSHKLILCCLILLYLLLCRPVCLSRPGGSSVCVSLCYNAAIDMLVGSFKPKPITVVLNEGSASSSTPPLLTSPTATAYSQAMSSSTPQDGNSPSTSISVHIPTHFSFSRKSRMPSERGDFSAVHTNSVWEQRTAMVGHKSQLLMSRTTIVKDWTNRDRTQIGTSEGGQGCLFASGDDGSNSVWLWDVGCPNVKQMLTPHPTPVLDIRNTHVAGMDLLGCVSERTLQIYRR